MRITAEPPPPHLEPIPIGPAAGAATEPLGRVLLGTVGLGDDWSELRDHLLGLGWQVDPFDPLPPGDEGGPELTLPRFVAVDHVIVVVSAGGLYDADITGRLAHVVGVLQGKVGFGQVIVVTDEEAEPFPFGTGTTEIHFERGEIASRFGQVTAAMAEAGSSEVDDPRPESGSPSMLSGWSERLRVDEYSLAPEWWLIGGLVTVLAVVVAVSLYQVAGSSGPEATSNRVSAGPLTDVLVDVALDPPEARSGSVTALPATCVIDTRTGVLPDEIACEGAGGLAVVGYMGPWNESVGAVSIDTGVVADLVVRVGGPSTVATQVEMGPGAEQAVPTAVAGAAVDELTLQFSANGQRVRLHQAPGEGGNEVTFIFDLNR